MRRLSLSLRKRGGAAAGDPNHPSVNADPNATYNPYPPLTSYSGGVKQSEASGSTRGFVIMALFISIFGFLVFLLIGWALIRQNKRKARVRIIERLSSVGRQPLFDQQSTRYGWNQATRAHDQDHEVDSNPDYGDTKHQTYGNEVFEMSHEFNQSSFSLPFDVSITPQRFEEEDDDFINSSNPSPTNPSSSPRPLEP